MAMVKCLVCNQRFDREVEPYVKHGRRYMHERCHPIFKKRQGCKLEQEEIQKQESKQRQELIQYVMQLQNTKRPHGMVLKQIKEFHEMGYTYIGMKSTLYYFHEVLGNPVRGTGIGIVPYVYDDAIEWFLKRKGSETSYQKLVKQGIPIKTTKVIHVPIKREEHSYKKSHKIDIENL